MVSLYGLYGYSWQFPDTQNLIVFPYALFYPYTKKYLISTQMYVYIFYLIDNVDQRKTITSKIVVLEVDIFTSRAQEIVSIWYYMPILIYLFIYLFILCFVNAYCGVSIYLRDNNIISFYSF
jgi:hypothetical protein